MSKPRQRSALETTIDPTRRTWSFTPRTMEDIDLPSGPWDSEPDKVQWIDTATNLDCLMVRNHFATWCGYVGVPRTHPLHGLGVDQLNVNVDVHGGVNFAELCAPGEPIDGICHIAEPGREKKPWWFGFDCGHYNDLQPGMLALGLTIDSGVYRYRTEDYVQSEVEHLAQQLQALAHETGEKG